MCTRQQMHAIRIQRRRMPTPTLHPPRPRTSTGRDSQVDIRLDDGAHRSFQKGKLAVPGRAFCSFASLRIGSKRTICNDFEVRFIVRFTAFHGVRYPSLASSIKATALYIPGRRAIWLIVIFWRSEYGIFGYTTWRAIDLRLCSPYSIVIDCERHWR
jgi:hypothetical protein